MSCHAGEAAVRAILAQAASQCLRGCAPRCLILYQRPTDEHDCWSDIEARESAIALPLGQRQVECALHVGSHPSRRLHPFPQATT